MADQPAFNGFPRGFVKFFHELSQNNNKQWFEQNREEFEQNVMSPAREFVVHMGRRLETLSPGIHAEPRQNGSIFRIYRDVRFSKDKTPYKTHQGFWFWEGNRAKLECSGYYVHIEPPHLMLGSGIYMFPDSLLKAYREAVVHPLLGPALVDAVEEATQGGNYILGGKHYKKTPRGFDPDHPNAAFLLHNGLHMGFETLIPDVLYSPQFVDYCFEVFKGMSPIHNWLRQALEQVEPEPGTIIAIEAANEYSP